jgi:glutamate formiminotransferase/formiminotetrahydrofolate cyclodeaminase
VGPPTQIGIAAFQGISKALDLIDMRKHKGTHPRMGAVDVCPLVPLSGVSMQEVVALAEKLAEKVGLQCRIPVFKYELNASLDYRKKLSQIRSGEYEGWFQKIKNPAWKPDFGPDIMSENSGVLAIGAREMMIAYNVNLVSTDVALANLIARQIRESGFSYRNSAGEKIAQPGLCKGVRAIGWLIPEFKGTQISMNLMDLKETPLWKAFITCRQLAQHYGLSVSGSEIVGMVPEAELWNAGSYFLGNALPKYQKREVIATAIDRLGLSDKMPFIPEEKIIEWRYNA